MRQGRTLTADGNGRDAARFAHVLLCLAPLLLGPFPASAALLTDYRMDADLWTGGADEVVDATGNGHDATAIADADTEGVDAALPGDPGTCRYGELDGSGDFVEDGAAGGYLNGLDAITVTMWIRNRAAVGNDNGLFATGATSDGQDNRLGMRYDLAGADTGNSNLIKASINTDACAAGDDCLQVETESGLQVSDQWQHVTMTWESGDKIRIYIGDPASAPTEVGTTVTGSGIGVHTGVLDDVDFLRIGESPKSAGDDWQGSIDEFRIYDSALSVTGIQQVWNETHACAFADGPVAHYALDEASYSGAAGEVIDSSGNGNAGTTVGRADNVDPARVCTGAAPRPNNRDNQTDAIDTGVDVDARLRNRGSINFYYRSDRDWDKAQDQMLFDASTTTNNRYFYLSLNSSQNNQGARLTFGLEDDGDTDHAVETGRLNFARDEWVHIGVTWDMGVEQLEIYVNGSLTASNGFSGTGQIAGLDTLYFGDNRSTYIVNEMTGRSARGAFDEIRLYDGVIDAARMAADRDASHACPGEGPDHYAVAHDGTAITCGEEQITITGHGPGHQALDPGNITLTLNTSTGEGTWARVISGSGALADTTAGDGAATYTFPGNGETAVTLAFNYTTVTAATDPETVNFNVQDGAGVTETSGNADASEDPDLVVSLSGFRITDGSGNALSIPEQIAGKPSDTAPGAVTLALQAVRASDNDPSLCEPYFPDAGDVEVELGGECADPATCAGRRLEVTNNGNTTAVATSDDDGGTGAVAYTPVTLRFGPNAEAPLVLEYDDAGRVQLHARYNAIDDGTATPPVVRYMVGASNAFAVRPFGFEVNVAGDDDTTGAGGTILAVAGDDVDTTVRAVAWQSADDSDDDGQPDAGADLSDNNAAPNFGNEAAPETVTLAPTVAAPAGGSDGMLSAATFSSFASGSETHGVSWSEVGHVHMDAAITDGSYLGGGDATGRADTVGRFIPADFNVVVASDGDLDAACAATFTYTGQPAGYATGMEPRLTITARNRAGTTTTNYRGAYAKMTAADVDVSGPSQDASEVGRAGNPVAVASSINTGTLVANGDGTLTHTFAGTDTFTYAKVDNARIDPFMPDLDLAVTGADDGEAAADPAVVPLAVEPAATHDIRFGRLAVDGAIGSERAPIDQPVRAEYWLNGTWQAHGADGCTQLTLAGELQLANTSGTVSGDQSIAVGGGTTDLATNTPDPVGLVAGEAVLTFAAPGAGNTGWVDTTATLAANLPWLRHDWDDADGAGDGPYDDLPVGRVTFGVYAGSPNWIHFRRTR